VDEDAQRAKKRASPGGSARHGAASEPDGAPQPDGAAEPDAVRTTTPGPS